MMVSVTWGKDTNEDFSLLKEKHVYHFNGERGQELFELYGWIILFHLPNLDHCSQLLQLLLIGKLNMPHQHPPDLHQIVCNGRDKRGHVVED